MENEQLANAADFDDLFQDRPLQMLKAAIPYVEETNKKNLALFIKFMELQRTFSIFNGSQESLKICSAPEGEEAPALQMLSVLKEFCTEREQENINMMINLMQMFSTYETLFN